jgi:two-component system chemotaxis response regulator CheY
VLRRQERPVATIPALVISTEAAAQDREAARAAGGNFYLVKPVSQETLIEYASTLCGLIP